MTNRAYEWVAEGEAAERARRHRAFLRIEIHPTLGGSGWTWRLTEPRPGRNAVLRRKGVARTWLLAAVAALWACYRFREGVMQ